jgi:hypothetical protein
VGIYRVLTLALLSSAGLWAQQGLSAYRAQLNGPFGPINGVLLTVGNQLVFVDSAQPELSFAIPRSGIGALTLQSNGGLSAQLRQPVASPPSNGQSN